MKNNQKRKKLSQSYLHIVFRNLIRNKAAIFGTLLIGIFILTALIAPLIVPYDPIKIKLQDKLMPPSLAHPLGTDELGRDVLTRIAVGARITLIIIMGAVSLALIIGAICGVVAGFYGGWIDNLIMRWIDILMAMPGFLLAIAIIAALGVGTTNVIIAVGVYSIPAFARIARASTLSVKETEFIMAANAIGTPNIIIMLRHILPNIIPPLIVQTTLRMATAILSASGLSFLGLGPQPPTPEWGAMLSTARNYISTHPLLVAFPGLAILLVTMSFNLLGDGLRDAMDPRLRGLRP